MKISTPKQLQYAVSNGKNVCYCKLKIVEVKLIGKNGKKAHIRTEGSDIFFTPWMPAVSILPND